MFLNRYDYASNQRILWKGNKTFVGTLGGIIESDGEYFKAVVYFGFTTLLTSQVISVAFYSEREKSDKFCSETLRHGTHEVILRIFTLWKNPSIPVEFEPANLGSSGDYDNHGTTGVDEYFKG